MQHSFQSLVDYAYIGVGGQFGVQPYSAQVPRWTIGQLSAELMGEYLTQPGNFLDMWVENLTQVKGIIQTTVNKYADDLGKWSKMRSTSDSDDPAWNAWIDANAKS